MDDLDGRLIDLFAARAADRRAGGVAPARRRPRHRPGPARQARRAGRDHRLGPGPLPEALGYPVTAFLTLEIRQGAGPRRRRRPPRGDPRGARGLHDHRRRRHVGAGRRPLQRRPPAGHRPGARRPRHRPLVDRDRARHPDPLPRAPARPAASDERAGVLAAAAGRADGPGGQDWATLDALLHPDFVYTNSQGARLTRRAVRPVRADRTAALEAQWFEDAAGAVVG